MSLRIERVNSLIKQRISEIFSKDLNIKPGVFLTVSKVDTSKDLRYSSVFVSVFPESEANYVLKTLLHEKGMIQKKLHSGLYMKILPKLNFKIDNTEAEADKIEKILNQL